MERTLTNLLTMKAMKDRCTNYCLYLTNSWVCQCHSPGCKLPSVMYSYKIWYVLELKVTFVRTYLHVQSKKVESSPNKTDFLFGQFWKPGKS